MVVLGGGVTAAMAALAVARALGRLGVEVTWVERGTTVPHQALIAPPDLGTFNSLLGLPESLLVQQASASLNMGQQFAGWSGDDGAFLNAYGDAGAAFASMPFVQHWARARQAGMKVPLEEFCLAAAAARHGRTGQPKNPEARQTVKHGHHLDSAHYAALLRAACVETQVAILPGECARPEPSAHGAALVLADGTRLEPDLFIDADGALVDSISPVERFSPVRPADHVIRASMPALDPLPLYSRVSAHRAGWLTMIPLSNRTALELAYDSALMSHDEARDLLPAHRLLKMAKPEALSTRSGSPPWRGNVVAIGPAAGAPPLLDGAELLLLQLAIAQLILLWPLDCRAMPEAAIYNAEMLGSRQRIEDFTAQHFHLNRRLGDPFWNAARLAPISDGLASKIALFSARGMFAHHNHEAHVEDAWALCLVGHGVVPESFDPQSYLVDEPVLMAEFQRQLRAVATDVRSMEPHADALRRLGA